jgi:hypothetical protein
MCSHIPKVLGNDTRWENFLFYKYCYHQAAFRSPNMDDENVEITAMGKKCGRKETGTKGIKGKTKGAKG